MDTHQIKMLPALLFIALNVAWCTAQTDCGMAKKDVVFVLDDSGSVTDAEFTQMISFANTVVGMYTINAANNIQVASVTNGGFPGAVVNFLLNSNGDSATVVQNMFNAIVKSTGGLTLTKRALEAARTQILAGAAVGDRPDADNIVIVILCGVSVDPAGAIAQADLLRSEDNAEIFVIAVGVSDLTEAQGIASDPDTTHLFSIPAFTALPALVPLIFAAACDDCSPMCQNNGVCDRPNNNCICPSPFVGPACALQLFQTCIHHHSCGGVTNGQYASCGSCKKYVTCTDGYYREFYCTGSQVYDATTGACVIDTGTVCSVSSMTSAATPVTKQPFKKFLFPSFHNGCDFITGCVSNCDGMADGMYHSCASCSKYMECTNQNASIKSCRWPYEFDDHSKSCKFISSSCHSSIFNFNFGFGSSSSGYGSGSSGGSYGSGSSGGSYGSGSSGGGYGSGSSSGGYGSGSSGGSYGSGSTGGSYGSGSSGGSYGSSGYGNNFFSDWWKK